jgi:hypothetical protein
VTRYAPIAVVGRAVLRYLLITVSYAVRDLVSPLLRGRPPRPESVRRRLRSLAGYLRLAPRFMAQRGSRGRSDERR